MAGTLIMGASEADFASTVRHDVDVVDDDQIVLHDDQPQQWKAGEPVVLLLHGLSGCHGSGYMMRIARKLNQRHVRTFRMDHRGCGAGEGLARHPYHAGRISDLHRAIQSVENLCPQSPISVAGFSLSGNLVLRYLGDDQFNHSAQLHRAVSVCPPIDLGHCVRQLDQTRAGQQYGAYFSRRLYEQVAGSPQWRHDVPLAQLRTAPRRLFDFDDMFTAPASGFDSADDYYEFASAKQYLPHIRLSTTILAASDDPLVSTAPFDDATISPDTSLCMTRHGGHLGFLGRKNIDADHRWMDWRVMDWLLH